MRGYLWAGTLFPLVFWEKGKPSPGFVLDKASRLVRLPAAWADDRALPAGSHRVVTREELQTPPWWVLGRDVIGQYVARMVLAAPPQLAAALQRLYAGGFRRVDALVFLPPCGTEATREEVLSGVRAYEVAGDAEERAVIEAALRRVGAERIPRLAAFDPRYQVLESGAGQAGMPVNEVRPGWAWGGEVLAPAVVVPARSIAGR